MKILFISNYFNHHQKYISDYLYKKESDFLFLATSKMPEERRRLGYGIKEIPSYVKDINDNTYSDKYVEDIVANANVIILGSAENYFETICKSHQKIIFWYTERIYKTGCDLYKLPLRCIRFWNKFSRYKSQYLLCASAYTSSDFAKTHTFINKAYKWGYFPETRYYDVEKLLNEKNCKRILWCGRFIDWKHPGDAIEVAGRLLFDGYDFEMDFIGIGEMEETMNSIIHEKGLEHLVHILDPMRPEQVRDIMEQAGIYLFTSDFREGWGAVLNESMNSGCAVVASHAIGSVPFLMKHEENGLIYKNGDIDDLYTKVTYLLDHPYEQKRMGENAYHTIADLWNADVASKRFLKLVDEIRNHGNCDLYEDGPCSRAEIIKNNWFKG